MLSNIFQKALKTKITPGFLVGFCFTPLFSFMCCVVFCLSSSCVSCAQCWQCLWIIHSWFSLRFSLTCISYKLSDVLVDTSFLSYLIVIYFCSKILQLAKTKKNIFTPPTVWLGMFCFWFCIYIVFQWARLGLWCLTPFQIYRAGQLVFDEENRSTQSKPPTCRKSLTKFITKSCIEYTSPGRHSKSQH